jgi:hypothetical protein
MSRQIGPGRYFGMLVEAYFSFYLPFVVGLKWRPVFFNRVAPYVLYSKKARLFPLVQVCCQAVLDGMAVENSIF